MSTFIQVGTEIKEIDVLQMLPPDEGNIAITYGRIGTGKTTKGTRDIVDALMRGIVVYANWRVNWDGYDQRNSKISLLLGSLGLKKTFINIPKENFHYFPIKSTFIDDLSKLTSCSIYLDEGHIPFDSYEATRMEVEKRSAVFSSRHYDRSLYVYTQRANSVHVNLRGNANRFYKCEKIFDFSLFKNRFIRFQITEFQDLTTGGSVDETRVLDKEGEETNEYKFAISTQKYWGRKKLFALFDSKYLRGDVPESQKNFAQFYRLTWKESFVNLFKNG